MNLPASSQYRQQCRRCLEAAVLAGFMARVGLQAVYAVCALPFTVFAKMMQPGADKAPGRQVFGEFAIGRLNGIIDAV